jgi:hypothetical protein
MSMDLDVDDKDNREEVTVVEEDKPEEAAPMLPRMRLVQLQFSLTQVSGEGKVGGSEHYTQACLHINSHVSLRDWLCANFLYFQPDEIVPVQAKEAARQELMAAVKQYNMAPFYVALCEAVKMPGEGFTLMTISFQIFATICGAVDKAQLDTMLAANTKRLQELESKIEDAVENLGESEVRDAHLQKAGLCLFVLRCEGSDIAIFAEYLLEIGDKVCV